MIASEIWLNTTIIICYIIDHIQFDSLTVNLLLYFIIGYLILTFLHYFISIMWDYTLFGGAVILERWLRSKLMKHFLQMTPTFFGRFRTGDLMARSTND